MHSLRKHHFEVVFRVLRYLKGTVGLGITFRKQGNLDLFIYTDSNFAGCLLDRRSTIGYYTFKSSNMEKQHGEVTWRKSCNMEKQETKCSLQVKY